MFWNRLCAASLQILFPVKFLFVETCLTEQTQFKSVEAFEAGLLNRYNNKLFLRTTILIQVVCRWLLSLERSSIAFTANGKRQAEISRLPKTGEIYLVSAYILPVSHSYGATTTNREIS